MNDDIELTDEDETVFIDDNELDTDALEVSEPAEQETVLQDDDNGGKQEEDEGYGKKVQKRINKLVSERNIERDENKQLRNRLDKLENRYEEDDNKRETEETNDKLADIKRRKMEFMDEGEYEKAEELNDELLDLKIEQRNKPKKVERQQEQGEQQGQVQQLPESQQAWMDGNDWYGSNRNSPKAQYANSLYQELVDEGYDPQDKDTYSELDKRLGNTTNNKPGAKPPGPGAPDRGSVSGSSKQVKFTQRDTNTMREYGLDPNDPAQRKEWLNNKKG